jgi:hypothetical protein
MTEAPTTAPTPQSGWIQLNGFAPLRSAERVLLRAYLNGDIARVGLRRPLVPSANTTIRGEFIAFLARGGVDGRFEPQRIQIVGAWIEGRIDLRHASIPESLWFYRCVFNAVPRLEGARIGGSASFPGCLLPGLNADDCSFAGNLALNSGCTVRTELRMARATIGRDLNLDRLQLRSAEHSKSPIQRRVMADGARISGNAILSGGLEAAGDVRLVGMRVAGDLRVSNARLSAHVDADGGRGEALNLDQIRVAGNVTLDQGFAASGLVRMKQARIEGDLDCSGAMFDSLGDMAWRGATTLLMDRVRIGGTLALTGLKRPLAGASLADAQVGTLSDDDGTWGERLVLDGFRYGRFGAAAPVSAPSRLSWLRSQEPAHLGKDFRPQPWRQLIGVLRRMQRSDVAREVAVEREAHLRRIGLVGIGMPRALRWLPRLGHRLLGALLGYGHRPARLAAALVVLWLACGALYWAAAENGAIAPTNPAIFNDPRVATCRDGGGAAGTINWTRCPELPAEYPAFQPFAYSLDLLLPFVDLRQSEQWAAVSAPSRPARAGESSVISTWGVATRVLGWYEVLFGWVALLLFAALLTGAFERDR